MKDYKEEKTLAGTVNDHNKVFKEEYKYTLPMVKKMIREFGGDEKEADDIFQEALIVVYRKMREGDLKLTCKLSTYIYSICRKMWLHQKKEEKYFIKANASEMELVSDIDSENIYKLKMREIYDRHFSKLSKDCQKILSMSNDGLKINIIQKTMKYRNVHHTNDRKYRCKASLMRRILNDPETKEINDETKKASNPSHGRNVG